MFARFSMKRSKKSSGNETWKEKLTLDGFTYYFNEKEGLLSWEKPVELMTKEEQEDGKSHAVWVPHPDDIWQPATVIKEKGSLVEVRLENGQKATVSKGVQCDGMTAGREQMVPLWEVNKASLKRPEEDLVMLDSHNEAMLSYTLKTRYKKDELYTWVGAAHSVLISVNPYKMIPDLYSPEVINTHANRPPNKPLPPHTYDIANNAYRSLLYGKNSQSILISGESGAGKTVCTKQCLDFFAQVAGSSSNVHEKVLLSNPLLESFGNAQTLRNNNSSRFGKYIEVHFSTIEGSITSAEITNYLLEKSRVVYQQHGERNYHIFYQLCGHSSTRSKLGLGEASSYNYLNKSRTYKAKDIDDSEQHDEVLKAMSVLEFSDEEQNTVLNATAGVLLLGNIEFKEKSEPNGVTGSKVADKFALEQAAEFLKVSPDDLEQVLTYRTISTNTDSATVPLNPEAARVACDSLAMGVYSRLFTYLVEKVNKALEGETAGKTIGILDIYGFEVFEQNSLEQLLINYTNEALQQQFNRTTFKEEEQVYTSEGIDFEHVEFIDNQVVLDLIDAKPHGILLMLDDEIIVPQGSESKFMNRVESQHMRNEKFRTDTQRRLTDSLNFEIVHYAGIVNYNAKGFLEKNKDTLFQDAYDLLSTSQHAVLVELFPEEETRRQIKSLGYQFRRSLHSLMDSLAETESRYIRCIKPNDDQAANRFETDRVIEQMRYSGVFEAVEIRSKGYPFRLKHTVFGCRYGCINPKHRYKNKDGVALVKEIFEANKSEFRDVQYGKTMVFYRSREYKLLELLRNLALESIIPKQQSVVRSFIARLFVTRMLQAQKDIQDALDVGNDLEMLEAAIESVEEKIGTLRKIFRTGEPSNLKQAIAHREDLRKWKALEERLEKLVKQDPNKVYYELADAVDEGKAMMHIPQTDRQRELIEEAIELRANSDLGKIDARCEEAIASLHREELEEISASAKQFGHTTKAIQEINALLALPEIEFVEKEIEVAKEQGDKERQIHREIRYEELWLEQHEREYSSINKASDLKSPEEYAKKVAKGLFKPGLQKRMANMMVWTKAAPWTPMTSAVELVGPDLKMFNQALSNMRQYAGDAKAKFGAQQAAAQFLAYVKSASGPLLDELYLQTMKQCQSNPNGSEEKYYELLGLMLETQLPSEDMIRFVLVFVKKQSSIPYKSFTTALRNNKYDRAQTISAGQIDSAVEKLKTTTSSRYSYKPPKKEPAEEPDEDED